MRWSLVLGLALGLIIVIVMVAVIYARTSPYLIYASDAKERIKRKEIDIVLDVRTVIERQNLGYYPGSIHMPIVTDLPLRYPDRNIHILIYCNTGQRARIATEKLQKLGYKNVHYIATSHLSLM